MPTERKSKMLLVRRTWRSRTDVRKNVQLDLDEFFLIWKFYISKLNFKKIDFSLLSSDPQSDDNREAVGIIYVDELFMNFNLTGS